MSLLDEIQHLAQEVGEDAEALANKVAARLREEALEHPQTLFELLRTLKPVLVVHGIAIVTRYDDVIEVLHQNQAFSVSEYGRKMRALEGEFILGTDDSPAYRRELSILERAAPRTDVPKLADFAAAEAEALVAAGAGRINVVDLTSRFAARLSTRWFGTPGPDEDTQIAWALAFFADIFLNLQNDPGLHAAAEDAAARMRAHLNEVIAGRKAAGAAGDDVLGRLLAMQADPDTAFTDAEIRGNLIGLIVGFIPTVMASTTLALDALLDRPEALSQACEAARAGDLDTVRAYLWEAMRLAPMAPGVVRRAVMDFRVAPESHHATTIPAGTLTIAATQSAMVDGRAIDDPGEVRPGRPAEDYLFFGDGLHQCFGRFVNEMQVPTVAAALLRRPGLRRAHGDDGDLRRDAEYPTRLVVEFDA
jgi:cytochrome P450